MASNIGMYCDREAELVLLSVEVIEVVSPEVFNITRIHPAMRIGCFLDEHHRREVVQIPIGGDLDKRSLRARLEGNHPGLRMLAIVYLRP